MKTPMKSKDTELVDALIASLVAGEWKYKGEQPTRENLLLLMESLCANTTSRAQLTQRIAKAQPHLALAAAALSGLDQ